MTRSKLLALVVAGIRVCASNLVVTARHPWGPEAVTYRSWAYPLYVFVVGVIVLVAGVLSRGHRLEGVATFLVLTVVSLLWFAWVGSRDR